MHSDTRKYNDAQPPRNRAICELLAAEIDRGLPESENKVWHRHPVCFLEGNPIVGYSKLADSVRLIFWSASPLPRKVSRRNKNLTRRKGRLERLK